MKATYAELIKEGLKEAGFNFVASLFASQLYTLEERLRLDPNFISVGVANEGEGAAVCAGAWLGGRMPLLLVETSGILVATHSLVYCHATFGIPTLLMSTYRGDLGEQEWYAVHTGAALAPLLQAVRIPMKVVTGAEEIKPTLMEARRSMNVSLQPISVVLAGRLTRDE
jgi:sulfopyruvate decarboxylase TPP-binding subunit